MRRPLLHKDGMVRCSPGCMLRCSPILLSTGLRSSLGRSGRLEDPLDHPPGQPEGGAVEPRGPVAGCVAAGLAARAHAELRARQPEQLELAVVGVARALVPHPPDGHSRAPGGAEHGALDTGPGRGRRRAQPERAVAPHLVQRQRDAQAPSRPVRSRPAGERERAEVVGRSGVEALLRAGGHQPDVAARMDAGACARRARPARRGRTRCRWRPEHRARNRCGPSRSAGRWAACRTIPITLRDRPRPGTANPWTATRSPAPLKMRRMRRWARASAALAAGRGPRAEMPVATE